MDALPSDAIMHVRYDGSMDAPQVHLTDDGTEAIPRRI